LNHLLNFHYVQADAEVSRASAFTKHGYHHRAHSKKYNKEQFLQANCQFVVKADSEYDYRQFSINPDALVEWDRIEKVLVSSSEESQCPICLYPPVCGRMTRCGHIFCFSCMLHYLSLTDKTWRKCPICYESVHLGDLRSANSKQNHHPYKVGGSIMMELMKRDKGSLQVLKASEVRKVPDFPNFSDAEDALLHSKIIMANRQEILDIIEKEMLELEFQSIEDGDSCPENIFVQQAMEIMKQKQKELLQPKQALEEAEVSTTPLKEKLLSVSDDGNKSINDETDAGEGSKRFFFYQAQHAQNIFLHSINSRMLQQSYESLEHAPNTIQGKIVQIQCFTMDHELRKRFKYLQHLPISSVFEIVEIDFDRGLVSHDVMDLFRGKPKLIKKSHY
jgi:Zinc finger, C3HC4 type (RING finger)